MPVSRPELRTAFVTGQLSAGAARFPSVFQFGFGAGSIRNARVRTSGGELMPSDAAFAGVREADAPQPIGGWPKRLLDVSVAMATLLAVLPLMIVVALLIRITSGNSAIFAHNRVGYGGRTFPCLKFRTMVRDADAALAAHLASDPEAALEWSETQKLRNDPRVTPLGRLLRKSSLDELPQLINILRGDMSCVGPRPITFEELERYGESVGDYLSARPGLTGLWQVAGRSSTDFATRVALDRHYVRNWSFTTDIMILAKTPVAVLRTDEVC